jgi:hypothetical protein
MSSSLTFDINPLSPPSVLEASYRAPDPAAAPAPAPAAPAAPAALPSRSRRRRAKKTRGAGAGGAAGGAWAAGEAQPSQEEFDQAAPWVEDAAAEAAENREERRAALRKAIAARRTQRTGRQALAARSERRGEDEGEGGGIEAALSQLDPSQFSSAALAAAAARMGIPASQIPNRRTLMRKLGNVSAAELLAAGRRGKA